MMNIKSTISIVTVLFAFSAGAAVAQDAAPAASTTSTHAVAGDLEKVSSDGKTITVKSASGAKEVFKVTGKTTYDGAKDTALAGKEGTHVVVEYTGKGMDKTAVGVKDAGKGTWKVTEGTVTKVADGGKEVTVKMKDGTEKTFHVGKEATIETAHGVDDAGKYTAKAGDKVAVYTTVDPTKEVVNLFKKL